MMRRAETVAVELELAIYDLAKGAEKLRKDKFFSMMSVLVT